MTIALVNSGAFSINTTQNGGGTTNITLGWTPTNGNTLILTLGYHLNSQADITSITQTGATWAKAVNENAVVGQPSNGDAEIWYASNISGASTSIAINMPTYSNYGGGIVVSEWSGLANSSVLDQTASNYSYGTITSLDSGTTGTTAQANELVIAAFEVPTVGQANSFSGATNGFTILGQGTSQGAGSYGALCATYKIASSAGTFDTQITPAFSYASAYNDACIATFKGAGGTVSSTATFSAAGSLAAVGVSHAAGKATFSASTSLIAIGASLAKSVLSIAGSASFSAHGASLAKAHASFAASGIFTADGHDLDQGKLTISAQASLAAVGAALAKSTAAYNASASLQAVGIAVKQGEAAFFAAGVINFVALVAAKGTAHFAASANFAAIGLQRVPTPGKHIILPQMRTRSANPRKRQSII